MTNIATIGKISIRQANEMEGVAWMEKQDYETIGYAYEDIEKTCTRQSAKYREYLDEYADDLDSSALLVMAAKIDAIEFIRALAAEKAKAFYTCS